MANTKLSTESIDILFESWRPKTIKRYERYINQWVEFCSKRKISPIQTSVTIAIEFLTEVFHAGVGYSSLGTARSALSSFVTPINGIPLGQQPLVKRFMKGVFNIRPSFPKYTTTWNPDIILSHITNLTDNCELSLKQLSQKLAILLCLLSGQRDQTITKLSLDHMSLGKSKCTFFVPELLKTSRPGFQQPPIEFLEFPSNKKLCIVATLCEYIKRTENIRSPSQLLIRFKQPHKAVQISTVSRWCKQIMASAGIDVTKGLSLKDINKAAGWTTTSTFAKFYHKPVHENFGNSVIDDGNHKD